MPEIASWPSVRHQPPLVSAGSAHTTEPPETGVPAVVGVLTAFLELFEPLLLLPLLEQAAASSASATTSVTTVRGRRVRNVWVTVPPAVGAWRDSSFGAHRWQG